jgi:hypothetical protein
MRAAFLAAIAVTAAAMLLEQSSLAADLSSPAVNVAPAPDHVRVVRRSVRYRSYRTAYRTIGMPCVLRPHVIVRLNWNGPQCRWVDNVIPFDRSVRRYRVAARRF